MHLVRMAPDRVQKTRSSVAQKLLRDSGGRGKVGEKAQCRFSE